MIDDVRLIITSTKYLVFTCYAGHDGLLLDSAGPLEPKGIDPPQEVLLEVHIVKVVYGPVPPVPLLHHFLPFSPLFGVIYGCGGRLGDAVLSSLFVLFHVVSEWSTWVRVIYMGTVVQ